MDQAQPAECEKTSDYSPLDQLEQEQRHLIRRLAEIEEAKAALRANPDLARLARLIRGY